MMINYSPKLVKCLIDLKFFKDNPLTIVDVGARGGYESHWSIFGHQAKIIGFEPDEKACKEMNESVAGVNAHFYPVALAESKGKKPFYATSSLLSAGFYQPDEELLKRFFDIHSRNLRVEKVINIEAVDFDSFAKENNIGPADFIKLDAEGSELDILKGAKQTLANVIGVSVEVCFLPLHKGRPVFSDVDAFLRNLGFQLFDLEYHKFARKNMQNMYLSTDLTAKNGQIIWGQALYLRDFVKEINQSQYKEYSSFKILKIASIMELFGLRDCAVELLQVAKERGILKSPDVDLFIKELSPNKLTTRLYLSLRLAKRAVAKILPFSIKEKLKSYL